MFSPTKISIFYVQHFITVCNIVCANGGNICISIKYVITIWKHVAEFHVYFMKEWYLPLFALKAPFRRRIYETKVLAACRGQAVHIILKRNDAAATDPVQGGTLA